MVWTKFSATAASNTAAPPDGAPEGMPANAVNNTMRDMMAEIRILGDYTSGAWTDISATATCNISAAGQHFLRVLGTSTINAFDNNATSGIHRILRFAAACQLTHNATKLILPGAANITTAANDTAHFSSLGSGNWICTNYQTAAGYTPAGTAQPLDNQLTALAGIGSAAADTMPLFESSLSATVVSAVSFGRGLLALTSAAALSAAGAAPTVVHYTRDVSVTGTQTLSNVTFTPRLARFFGSINGQKIFSTGGTNGTVQWAHFLESSTGNYVNSTGVLLGARFTTGVTEAQANFVSFNSTGMLINWGKTGAPTGTMDFDVEYYP
jgi:hypothetical protein